jgi:hypothetical protein
MRAASRICGWARAMCGCEGAAAALNTESSFYAAHAARPGLLLPAASSGRLVCLGPMWFARSTDKDKDKDKNKDGDIDNDLDMDAGAGAGADGLRARRWLAVRHRLPIFSLATCACHVRPWHGRRTVARILCACCQH